MIIDCQIFNDLMHARSFMCFFCTEREIRRLMKQVVALKQRNAVLVKLLQETGLRFDADDGVGEFVYTIPGGVRLYLEDLPNC